MPPKSFPYPKKLDLPERPFSDGELHAAYELVCEVLYKRKIGREIKPFVVRQAVSATVRLSTHAGPHRLSPGISPMEGELADWRAWLLGFPELTPPKRAVLDYLYEMAVQVDRDSVDRARSLLELGWDDVRSGRLQLHEDDEPLPRQLAVLIGMPDTNGRSDLQRTTWLKIPAGLAKGDVLLPQAEVSGKDWERLEKESYHLYRDALYRDDEPLMEFAGDALTALETVRQEGSWPELIGRVEEAWREAFGSAFHDTRVPVGRHLIPMRAWLVDLAELYPSGLVNAYGAMRKKPLTPLLEHVIDGVPTKAPMHVFESRGFLGGMDESGLNGRIARPLDPTQRLAAQAVAGAALDMAGEVIPINGPPGTGKTTVLRAVIASLWVQDAIAGSEFPRRVWGTGFTNKAVRNVIEAFGSVAGAPGSGFYSRWINGLPSYGWFAPSVAAQDASNHLMQLRWIDKLGWTSAGAAASFSTVLEQGVDAAIAHYLQAARDADSKAPAELDEVINWLQAGIRNGEAAIKAAEADFGQLIEQWYANPLPAWRDIGRRRERELLAELDSLEAQLQNLDAQAVQAGRDLPVLHQAVRLHELRERDWRLRLPGWIAWLFPVDAAREADYAAAWASALRVAARAGVEGGAASLRTLLDASSVALGRIEREQAALKARQQAVAGDIEQLRKQRARWLQQAAVAARVLQWPSTSRFAIRAVPKDPAAARAGAMVADRWNELQSELDTQHRFWMFHLAARYWEGRYLKAWKASHAAATPADFRAWSMLAPIIVVTARRYLRLAEKLGMGPDVLIMDESGQCSTLDGVALMATARLAVLVGDVAQLPPIAAMSDVAGERLAAHVGLDPKALPTPFAASGSMMEVAHRAARRTDGGLVPGVTLRYHYRCVPDIIGYCNKLAYGGVIIPKKPPARPGERFHGPGMQWIDVQGEPVRVGSSWSNPAEAEVIARWLVDELPVLRPEGTKLNEVVAVLAPLKAQVGVLRRTIELALKGRVPADEIRALTIGTVHALQGDERPVVAFSLVQRTDMGGSLFADRGGPNLMNVAVSRAKNRFVVFADRGTLKPTVQDGQLRGTGAIAQLGAWMREHGCEMESRYSDVW